MKAFAEKLFNKIPTKITKSGWWFIGVSILTSGAAYQSGSNVLFLALSCMLSALLLNGLISWWNYSRIDYRPLRIHQFRVGESGNIVVEILDHKKTLKSLGLEIALEICCPDGSIHRLRAPVLNHTTSHRAVLSWAPESRGVHQIHFKSIDSHFPFGFIRKQMPVDLRRKVRVWPGKSPVDCIESADFLEGNAKTYPNTRDETVPEIAGIRPYIQGETPRLIHWKKSARLDTLVSKHLETNTSQRPLFYWFNFSKELFSNESEVEKFCEKIGSLSEDLSSAKQDHKIMLHDRPPLSVTSRAQWSTLMDELAIIQPSDRPIESPPSATAKGVER